MDPNLHWRPPPEPPRTGRSWLPAAIMGSAIVIAAGLIAGALILKDRPVADGPTTCQAWDETRQSLRSIPALPGGWTWRTPKIDTLIRNQNAPVGKALDLFETKIAAEPADVARAAREYIAARREQMASLADRTYTPEVGAEVDSALLRLDELCGIPPDGRPI